MACQAKGCLLDIRTMNEKVKKIITSTGPKKILTLDGGGTRGFITIEILERIEAMLRRELNKDDSFVLSDYFDFIAGTSIGAIIASLLSWGLPVKEIRTQFEDMGPLMFRKNSLWLRWRAKFDSANFTQSLQDFFGPDRTLGTEKLNTLLMLIMRNSSTDSHWPITNNPFAIFNNPDNDDCNLEIPLWQLIRASTAAPTFFPPEKITLGKRDYYFEDGAISSYNNPSFLAFLQATVEPYNINWKSGEKDMLIVSVGNGNSADQEIFANPFGKGLLDNAKSIPGNLLYAALNEQDTLCRIFGRCLLGHKLDYEIGDLINSSGPISPKLFTYLRYDFETTQDYLNRAGIGDVDIKVVNQLTAIDSIDKLQRVGRYVGEQLVKPEHYHHFLFDNSLSSN